MHGDAEQIELSQLGLVQMERTRAEWDDLSCRNRKSRISDPGVILGSSPFLNNVANLQLTHDHSYVYVSSASVRLAKCWTGLKKDLFIVCQRQQGKEAANLLLLETIQGQGAAKVMEKRVIFFAPWESNASNNCLHKILLTNFISSCTHFWIPKFLLTLSQLVNTMGQAGQKLTVKSCSPNPSLLRLLLEKLTNETGLSPPYTVTVKGEADKSTCRGLAWLLRPEHTC